VSAICSVPIGAPREEDREVRRAASCSGAARRLTWADASGTATPSAASARG
jgi:hypothetical protein